MGDGLKDPDDFGTRLKDATCNNHQPLTLTPSKQMVFSGDEMKMDLSRYD
jgi:hypothetical protein